MSCKECKYAFRIYAAGNAQGHQGAAALRTIETKQAVHRRQAVGSALLAETKHCAKCSVAQRDQLRETVPPAKSNTKAQ